MLGAAVRFLLNEGALPSNIKIDVWNLALDFIGETVAIASESEVATRVEAAVCDRHYDNLLREVLEQRHWLWALRQRPISTIDTQQTTSAAAVGGETIFDVPFYFLSTTQLSVVRIAVGGTETTLTAVTDYTITLAVPGTNAKITLIAALTAGQKIRSTVAVSRVGWDHVYALPSDFVAPVAILYSDVRFSLLDVDSRQLFAVMPNDQGNGLVLCTDMAAADVDALEYVALIDSVAMMPRLFVTALAWRLAIVLANALKKDPKTAMYCREQYEQALDLASAHDQNIVNDGREPLTPSLAARG